MTVYKLRIGGSNDYISAIDPTDDTCFPPGSTKCVQGISHPDAQVWRTLPGASLAAEMVEKIEGFHISIEPYPCEVIKWHV